MSSGKSGGNHDDYLPISALQHLVFCERQCALIHVEKLWVDNRLTVEGTHLHERVDETGTESRSDVKTARGVRLYSDRLGLVGRADVVEFHRNSDEESVDAIALDGQSGLWHVHPVEYKRGKPKPDQSDSVQLCAQAMCLEEMLGVRIERGYLYYGERRQRTNVPLDEELRNFTADCARRLHELVSAGDTPQVPKQPKCRRCSMFDVCLPHGTDPKRSASRYVAAALQTNLQSGMTGSGDHN